MLEFEMVRSEREGPTKTFVTACSVTRVSEMPNQPDRCNVWQGSNCFVVMGSVEKIVKQVEKHQRKEIKQLVRELKNEN